MTSQNLSMTYYDLSFVSQRSARKLKGAAKRGTANAYNRYIKVITHEKLWHTKKITEMLDYIIENDFYGNLSNKRTFYKIVTRICTQSRYECIYRSQLTNNFNLTTMHWLKSTSLEKRKDALLNKILYLLTFIVKPLIWHFYQPQTTFSFYEIVFIPRKTRMSFNKKILQKCIKDGHMIEVNAESTPLQSRGSLSFIPKDKCKTLKYRPIVFLTREEKTNSAIKIIGLNLKRILRGKGWGKVSLYNGWCNYIKLVQNKRLYGIKLDLQDAFGRIIISKLVHYVEKLTGLPERQKQQIISRILNQYVSIRSRKKQKIYQWKHGLLQGDRLSASLCELYMQCIEQELLNHLKTKSHCFMHRTVDDYFFCSTHPEDVDDFRFIIEKTYCLNHSKTVESEDNNNTFPYCGQFINLNTREISKMYVFPDKYEIRYKFKIFNKKRPIKKVQKLIIHGLKYCFNMHNFKNVEINTVFNSEATVLKNVFVGMVHVALKLDVMLKSFEDNLFTVAVYNIISKTIVHYCIKIKNSMEKYKGTKPLKITRNLLQCLAGRAFCIVLKKRDARNFKSVILKLNKRFGKFCDFNGIPVDPKFFTKMPAVFQGLCWKRVSSI